MSHRVEHPNGDYTIMLSSIVPGRLDDPVEPDYSFLDDDPVIDILCRACGRSVNVAEDGALSCPNCDVLP